MPLFMSSRLLVILLVGLLHRVQVFRLPGFESLGTFAEKDLRLPYGIALHAEAPDRFTVYVTDNYAMPDESVPPDSLLGERVRQYRVTVTGAGLRAEPVRAFGDTIGLCSRSWNRSLSTCPIIGC